MNSPNPALVTQRAAARLPRLALLLFCAAYVLPGLFGRDPWKNADITAFGYMRNMARGVSSWWAPTIAGLPSDPALLPYWLGATSIRLLGPLAGEAFAARVPFALLLVATLTLAWYSSYQLARSEAAQPLPFAFGGEAAPIDYARAIADGALLALIASLGLLQLGHETTPELAQLAGVSLLLYGLAASETSRVRATLAVGMALPALAASGAPSIALALGVVTTLLCALSISAVSRRFAPVLAAATAAAALVGWLLGAWAWRIETSPSLTQAFGIGRQLVWFLWPVGPLALWTLWRWRRQVVQRHIAVPLACALVPVAASLAMGGSDRALMLALPPLAVLAAFALPTLSRASAAAIDWFSVFFFSISALVIWVIYVAMQTGVPAQPAANVARLAPGFVAPFSPLALGFAAAGTLAWLWLVRWRTGRNRHPLWKSLVLAASGVALCWLLLMTLWLPLLDYARSYRPLVDRIAQHLPRGSCVAAPDLPRGALVALAFFGDYRVDATSKPGASACAVWLKSETSARPSVADSGWVLVAHTARPTDRQERVAIYRRADAARR